MCVFTLRFEKGCLDGMAKDVYKIPTSLDASYVDLEFNLQTKDGVGFKKPVNGKSIILGLLVIIAWFYFMFKTPVGSSGFFVGAGFTIVWLLFGVLMVKTDKTARHGFEQVLSMINYLQPSGRRADVRLFDRLGSIQSITGIEDVDPEDGMIHFLDGTVGRLYDVVGTASVLMFDQDKAMILRKVDNFYRKLPVGVEIMFDTVKESQRTDIQSQAAIRGYRNLNKKSPGLQRLYKERHDILKDGVGERFKSIHQYAIIKAPKDESLSEGESLMISDAENEGLMFKRVESLGYDDTMRYFKQLFGE